MPEPIAITSHGVTLDFDTERLADPRFTYCLSRVADDTVADDRKLVFYGRMLALMLGEDGAYVAMSDLAEANEGHADASLFNEFFADILEQARAKNS